MNTGFARFPEISVVVPVRNEASTISELLDDLLNQTLPPNEIVITDGGSTDGTRAIIEERIGSGAPVKLICESFSLPGRSRNIGAANARNDWIAFTDAGIRPQPRWLEELVTPAAENAELDVVYGTYEPAVDNFFAECAAIAYVPPPVATEEGLVRPHSIASALMRRRVWESVGGFPEDLRSAEDLLFMRKVERAGFRTARAAGAIVRWNLQPNLWRTFRRFVAYARHNIRAGLWREWQLAIFSRYTLLLLTASPAVLFGWRWLVVPLGLWLGMMIARAAKSIHRNRISYPAGIARNLARVLVLVPLLSVIDLAVAIGSVAWLVRDARRDSRTM